VADVDLEIRGDEALGRAVAENLKVMV
jgi:hypothetical protein